ncbi:MAG: methylmalonyl-CoA mutase family protein, partial [Anaerolineales bacterium]
ITRGLARGLAVDDFAGHISFNLDIFGNFFEQIAKFRRPMPLILRTLWYDFERTGRTPRMERKVV